MKNVGVILKITQDIIIVMTNKCEFVSIKLKPGAVVGQQIYFTKDDIINTESTNNL